MPKRPCASRPDARVSQKKIRSSPPGRQPLVYHYVFRFPRGAQHTCAVAIDPVTMARSGDLSRGAAPAWVTAGNIECGRCAVCHAAGALAPIVRQFSGEDSCRPLQLQVVSDVRSYRKQTTLEDALSSLLWLVIVTSGCPVAGRLRPLARFHLPTVTPEEMKFRMLSLHIAAQYFVLLNGKKPDWKLAGLKKYFHDFSTVLRSLRAMVQPAVRRDAVPNALTRLDCLAVNVALLNHRGLLEDMAASFMPYLKPRR